MSTLQRVRVTWAGTGVVGPSVSTFYFTNDSTTAPADLVTFLSATPFQMPTGLTATVPSSGDTIDDTTGEINGVWSITGGANVGMGGSGDFAQGVGARLVWNTAGIVAGRRVRGSTFFVPLVGSTYSTGGLLDSSYVSDATAAATTFLSSASSTLVIFSRPSGTRAGSSHTVTSGTMPNAVSWLRSRRT